MLDAALDYADQGIAVFPVFRPLFIDDFVACSCRDGSRCRHIGKHPRCSDGVYDATTDRQKIAALWKGDPMASIGIATGESAGFDVLDEDPQDDGDKNLLKLEAEFGALPATVVARTGGGGRHFLFRHTKGLKNGVKKLGRGLDFKTTGGYIVAAPSMHASGHSYAWERWGVAPALLPGWLEVKLREERGSAVAARRPDDYWQHIAAGVAAGERHDAVLSVAGRLLSDFNINPYLAVSLVYAYNQTYCDPPKSKEEVDKIIAFILRKAAKS